MADLVRDFVFVCGSLDVFHQMYLFLQAPGAPWEGSEAALFIMATVAKNILPYVTAGGVGRSGEEWGGVGMSGGGVGRSGEEWGGGIRGCCVVELGDGATSPTLSITVC